MDDDEIKAIRDEINEPAKRDYDARCENGSCHKAMSLANHTEELLDEVVRLRAWISRRFLGLGDFINYDFGSGDGPGSWAKAALDGAPAPDEPRGDPRLV